MNDKTIALKNNEPNLMEEAQNEILATEQSEISILDEIEFVRIVWCDNANIIRAKAVYTDSSPNFEFYAGISEAQQGVPVMFDGIIPESGLSPVGEVHLMADMSSFVHIPYSKSHGRAMGDMMKNGIPWDYCPRGFLKKMIQKALKMSIEIKGSFENEFYLLKEVNGAFEPADNSPFASTYSMDKNLRLFMKL